MNGVHVLSSCDKVSIATWGLASVFCKPGTQCTLACVCEGESLVLSAGTLFIPTVVCSCDGQGPDCGSLHCARGEAVITEMPPFIVTIHSLLRLALYGTSCVWRWLEPLVCPQTGLDVSSLIPQPSTIHCPNSSLCGL